MGLNDVDRLKMSSLGGLIGLLLVAGCAAPEGGEPLVTHPCDSAWGPAPSTGRVLVDAEARDDGDGSMDAPFLTLDAALAAARASGARSIVLAPGEYEGRYSLSQDVDDWKDGGLTIAGCGREETRIAGIMMEESIGGDDVVERLQPVFDVSGASTADITIHDLAVVGGRRGIIVRDGAGSAGPIVLERVDVLESLRLAVLIDGMTTAAELRDVRIEGVDAEGGAFGWGVSIQTGRQLADAALPDWSPVILEDVAVKDVRGIGVMAHGAWLDVATSEVSGVAAVNGALGRGMQIQQWSRGRFDRLVSTGNSDAAVFLESPGRLGADGAVSPIELLGCALGPTTPVDVPGSADQTGDGLVATQFVVNDSPYGAEVFKVVVDETTFDGNPRSHVLAEAVTLAVGGNNVFGKGTVYIVASQAEAVVEGLDGDEPGADAEFLDGADALGIDRGPVELDDLAGVE